MQIGCEETIDCTAVSVESIGGTVTDGAGNPLPVYEVYAQIGRTRRACSGWLGGYSCRDLRAGKMRVIAVVPGGEEIARDVTLAWERGNEGCHTERAELDLVKAGGCPALASASERSAVRGVVRDLAGAPISALSMQIAPSSYDLAPAVISAPEQQPCTVEDGRFDCPAVTPHSAFYQISANVDGTSLTREVYVTANECELEPVELELISDASCPEPRAPALEVVISRAGGGSAWKFGVSEVRATWEDKPDYRCTFTDRSDEEELYTCVGRNLTGAGHYGVEVSLYNGKSYEREVDVRADDCRVETERVEIVIP